MMGTVLERMLGGQIKRGDKNGTLRGIHKKR